MSADTLDVVAELDDLKVHFPTPAGTVRAVDGVSVAVRRGETLGLVGESGSGKSTAGLALLRLVDPTAGRVRVAGADVTRWSRRRLRATRRHVAMVFQDPQASLDPRRTVGDSIAEPLIVHRLATSAAARRDRVAELLDLVGLRADTAGRYPHELSGGQRQRVGVARALAGEPDLIVLDEPIASLDLSVQAQIMNLLRHLQRDLGLTYLFIAHDLAAVEHMSDRIAVMYLGRIVETGPPERIYRHPAHPYTAALLSAVPVADPRVERERRRIVLTGDIPSPVDPPSGCRFRTRCPQARPACAETDPALAEVGTGHHAACLFPLDGDRAGGVGEAATTHADAAGTP
ncbi:ABC transporter ATP-binding protein [Micromonospora aurantiaca]|uniref:ATP-binding cassette domain-containing protein n=1 Tax=Micromonospora aurantiaca (nom. illeg.) TaxID=47850 RepID=A0ABQ6UC19_9ACTN|nr:oligopeptide/dipeptide ABC transporter ATP-binding protein [Micromonospora aurantiaca]KAB1108403.1 ATP-binding cassette domain-containing protein [Micromonospora aurantiaca]UFN97446.1 ATP-binding cassette domain-containing protein [Micromonospora aurantiaca]